MPTRSRRSLAFHAAALAWTIVLASPLALGEGNQADLREAYRMEMLSMINRDRVEHGLRPVELDRHASLVADVYCEAQIRWGIMGHYDVDGLAPYMRYSFAGGNDGLSENAAAWSANYTFSETMIPELMRRSQKAMLDERPPNDGHRRTILDPHATHVGIGLAWRGGEFRLAQEFLRRYIDWTRPLPRVAVIGEKVSGAGRVIDGSLVDAVSVHHEPLPEPMHPRVINTITEYRLPTTRRDYRPVRGAWESEGELIVRRDGSFSFAVPFRDGPGVYTVVVWVSNGESSIAASTISIRVDRPRPGRRSAVLSR